MAERTRPREPSFHKKIYTLSGARFLARKYGLSADEAWQAARRPSVVEEHERWRTRHPIAASSPLSRDRLLEQLERARTEERAAGREARVLRRIKVRRLVRKRRGEQRAHAGGAPKRRRIVARADQWVFPDGKTFFTRDGAARHARRTGLSAKRERRAER